MRQYTYVLGNKAEFAAWCGAHNIESCISAGVRHVPNIDTAKTLGGKLLPHTVVLLRSADPAAVFFMRQAGYNLPLDPQVERNKRIEHWADLLSRWYRRTLLLPRK